MKNKGNLIIFFFPDHYMQIAWFDTHGDGNAGRRMKTFVDAIPYGYSFNQCT